MNGKLRHTIIEGWLYWYNGFAGGMLTYLASEESYKYLNAALRFWMIMLLGSSIAGFNAIKAFRSMTFGRAYGNPPEPTIEVQPTTTAATVQPQPIKH